MKSIKSEGDKTQIKWNDLEKQYKQYSEMVQWVQVWYSQEQDGEQTGIAAALQLHTKAGWFEKLDTTQHFQSFG